MAQVNADIIIGSNGPAVIDLAGGTLAIPAEYIDSFLGTTLAAPTQAFQGVTFTGASPNPDTETVANIIAGKPLDSPAIVSAGKVSVLTGWINYSAATGTLGGGTGYSDDQITFSDLGLATSTTYLGRIETGGTGDWGAVAGKPHGNT